MTETKSSSNRTFFLDNIRSFLALLVVLHHVAITYGGAGGWFWLEKPNASNLYLVAFNAINQSFFMGLFFLLAGYFSCASISRKGSKNYLLDRLVRLGLPLLFFVFLLYPLTVSIAIGDGLNFLPKLMPLYLSAEFGPGPLWFVGVLIVFSVIYVSAIGLFPQLRGKHFSFPGFWSLLLMAIGVAGISFFVRLVYPVGKTFLWMQLGYFPCYVFLFFSGASAYSSRFLEKVEFSHARPWILPLMIALVSLPFAMTLSWSGDFNGGMNPKAFYYAIWNPIMGFSIILILLWVIRKCFNFSSVILSYLSRRAYGIFILHPPVVVALSKLLFSWQLNAVGKFFVVGIAGYLACVVLTSLLLLVPKLNRII